MLGHFFSTWRRERARSRAIAELEVMSSRQLDDLGITRGEISDYVSGRMAR